MSETPAPTTAKPEPAPKAAAKPAKPAASKADPNALVIKSSPVNPAYAIEVAKAYGLAGSLADAVAAHLTEALTEAMTKVTQPDKLTKLVREAAVECIGKIA